MTFCAGGLKLPSRGQSLIPELHANSQLRICTKLWSANTRSITGSPLDDLMARWKLHLAPVFGFMLAANVSTDLVNRYIDVRQQEGASNASINRELAVLKRAFYLGMECTPPKVQNVPHFEMLKENNTRKGFLDADDYESLSRECGKFGLWMRTSFELGYTYGWRHAEVLGLRVNQVSITDQVIRLNPGETKNDEAREVNLTATLLELLKQCIQGKRDDDPVLTRDNGRPVRDFRGAWESATTKAGKPGLLFHDMRRTAIRNMVRAGISEKVAMQISGHKTRSIFERYNITDQRDVKEAVSRIDRQTARKPLELRPEIEADKQWEESTTERPN